MDIQRALMSIRPGATWSLNGETYDGLIWHEDNELPAPTEEEIITECERLQQEWDYNQYQRDRASAYPSIKDQLDTLYHGGLDAWREEINKVKEKYPKPE
jgi:hypothetical protein